MSSEYQARWITKQRVDELRRSGLGGRGVIVDSFNGFIVVEPVGSDLGDGNVLTPQEAEYELQPAWSISPNARLAQARQLLGLEAGTQTAGAAKLDLCS